jgi:uncharacterized membrane protein YdjX (TVP38/TMEM64 family)
MTRRHFNKLLILALMITAGIILEFAGLLDAERLLNIAREYADHWWLVLVLILLQVILFTFALAGSFFLWIAAPLYPPAMATFILTAGSTLGGLTAYMFSKRLTNEWIEKIQNSQTYKLLHNHDNFFTLFALRVLPAFPHALVNYSSGMLKVKISHFIAAAILGVSIKSYVYTNVIYNATTSVLLDELMDISTYGPLILLSAITLLGVFINYKLTGRNKQPE